MACQQTLKELLVGILIPTDVGLLIPTPPPLVLSKTAKTLDFEFSVEVLRELSSVHKLNQL